MVFHIKLINQRLCNGLLFPEECSGCHGKIFVRVHGGASYKSAPNLIVQLYVYIIKNQRLMLVLFEKTLRNFVRTSLFRFAQQ